MSVTLMSALWRCIEHGRFVEQVLPMFWGKYSTPIREQPFVGHWFENFPHSVFFSQREKLGYSRIISREIIIQFLQQWNIVLFSTMAKRWRHYTMTSRFSDKLRIWNCRKFPCSLSSQFFSKLANVQRR